MTSVLNNQPRPHRNVILIPRDIYRSHTTAVNNRDMYTNNRKNGAFTPFQYQPEHSSLQSSRPNLEICPTMTKRNRSTKRKRTTTASIRKQSSNRSGAEANANYTSQGATLRLRSSSPFRPSSPIVFPSKTNTDPLFVPKSPITFPATSTAITSVYTPPSPHKSPSSSSNAPSSPIVFPASLYAQRQRSLKHKQTCSNAGAETLASPTPSPEANKRIKLRLRLDNIQPPTLKASTAAQRTRHVIVISDDSDSDDTLLDRQPLFSDDSTAPDTLELTKEQTKVVQSIFPQGDDHSDDLRRAFLFSPEFSQNYRIGRLLGSGSSGFVVSARRLEDGRDVAIKIIPTDRRGRPDVTANKVNREIEVLTSLKTHENIMEFVEVFTSRGPSEAGVDLYFIVTELGESSLFDFIETHRLDDARADRYQPSEFPSGIRKEVVHSIFKQLARGLHSMHSQNVIHGDIKDENALVNVNRANGVCRAKLCDFGHAKRLNAASGAAFSNYGTTIMGPPEMDKNVERKEQLNAGLVSSILPDEWDRFYGFEADVFALGLLLYTMVHGDLPSELSEKDPAKLAAYKRRRESSRSFLFEVLAEGLEKSLVDLLRGMLVNKPKYRLNMDQVLEHAWVKKCP